MKDAEIVSELKRGNTTVLKHCYKKSLGQVERMVLQHGGTEEDAKDLFHDSLIVLNNNCKSEEFKLTSSLSTYLFAVCKYSWLNQKSKQKRKEDAIKSLYEDTWELAYKSSNGLVDNMMDALSKLGDNCREILLDYYYGKCSYEEIAMNLSYSNGQVVRQQKYRCIKKLKEITNYVVTE